MMNSAAKHLVRAKEAGKRSLQLPDLREIMPQFGVKREPPPRMRRSEEIGHAVQLSSDHNLSSNLEWWLHTDRRQNGDWEGNGSCDLGGKWRPGENSSCDVSKLPWQPPAGAENRARGRPLRSMTRSQEPGTPEPLDVSSSALWEALLAVAVIPADRGKTCALARGYGKEAVARNVRRSQRRGLPLELAARSSEGWWEQLLRTSQPAHYSPAAAGGSEAGKPAMTVLPTEESFPA